MKILFASLITLPLLAGVSARAGEKDTQAAKIVAACAPAADLQDDIKSCTDNKKAEAQANQCRDTLLSAWQAANAELTEVMSLAREHLDPKQQQDFFRSHSDMQLAIDKLQALVDQTEDGADKLSQYPRVMFDNPYADPGLDGSSNCYKKHFLAISKIVDDLDQKAQQGLDALAAVDQLRGVSQARDDGMSGTLEQNGATGGRGVAAGKSVNSASDVTGIAQDKAKQAGAVDSVGSNKISHPVMPAADAASFPKHQASATPAAAPAAEPVGRNVAPGTAISGVVPGSIPSVSVGDGLFAGGNQEGSGARFVVPLGSVPVPNADPAADSSSRAPSSDAKTGADAATQDGVADAASSAPDSDGVYYLNAQPVEAK